VDVGLDLAPLGALAARLVDVVDDDHSRRRDRLHVVPPLEGARAVALERLVLGADHARHRVADERAQVGKQALDLGRHVPDVARTDLEGLDGVAMLGC